MMGSVKVNSPKIHNNLNHNTDGLDGAVKNILSKMVEQICPDE